MKRLRTKTIGVALSLALIFTGCSSNDKKSASTSSEATSLTQDSDEKNESYEKTESVKKAEYADKLFDSSYVHKVDIEISEDDWTDLTENPTDKTKYEVNISIDGEKINDVSFATKENTSLTSVASDKDSDKYSFKVNFGKYVDGQTYYGLDKLNLNNIYADATYIKDYLSYEIFNKVGVDSPLTSYIWLTINGEDQGLYLAIEDIGDSYLERTDKGDGALYKPETSMLANMDKAGDKMGGMPDMGDNDMPSPPDMTDDNMSGSGKEMPDMGDKDMPSPPDMVDGNMPSPPDMVDGNMSGSGKGMPDMESKSNGADLKYTDDEIDSYSDIFDNAENDVTDEDNKQVISALKKLSEGNVEESLDTDEVIRYFAAHNFVLNYDSYTGNMLHNYYLYEEDGKLSMLPWDYNLAFGGFGGFDGENSITDGENEKTRSDATSLINTGIDSPLSGAADDSRPMWSWIVNNTEYKEKYHEIYNELISSYFESGEFDKEIDALYEMILPYVETHS